MSNKIHQVKILEVNQLASDIFSLVVERPATVTSILSCQFFNLGLEGREVPLLKRPISICDWNDTTITFVVKKIGRGTELLCSAKVGDELLMVGPLGNGMQSSLLENEKPWLLVGGGIGTAPLVATARVLNELGRPATAIMGYLDEIYLIDCYNQYCSEILPTTMNGAEGTFSGNAIQGVFEKIDSNELIHYNVVVCGPDKMLEAAKEQLLTKVNALYLVTEERMACGMGACLVCAKKVTREDGLLSMVRTCIEGPVFKGEEVVFE